MLDGTADIIWEQKRERASEDGGFKISASSYVCSRAFPEVVGDKNEIIPLHKQQLAPLYVALDRKLQIKELSGGFGAGCCPPIDPH